MREFYPISLDVHSHTCPDFNVSLTKPPLQLGVDEKLQLTPPQLYLDMITYLCNKPGAK